MVGRVYICEDGINAQVSGTTDDCAAYRRFVAAGFPEPPLFKEDPVAEPSFPRLRVKHHTIRVIRCSFDNWQTRLETHVARVCPKCTMRNRIELTGRPCWRAIVSSHPKLSVACT